MSKRILVAEDERAIAHALTLKLEKGGHTVTHVSTGKEALEKLTSESYDLAVLDLMMPGGDGFSVLEGLKAKGSTVPIVVTSNLGQEEDQVKVLAYGVKKYFVKSDTPINAIVDEINAILGS